MYLASGITQSAIYNLQSAICNWEDYEIVTPGADLPAPILAHRRGRAAEPGTSQRRQFAQPTDIARGDRPGHQRRKYAGIDLGHSRAAGHRHRAWAVQFHPRLPFRKNVA